MGILQQEPPLDEDKTVGENIKMAFGDVAAKVARFNEIGEEMANPDADFDALMEEMGKLQTEIDAANGWDLDSQLEQAMDALQCPDPDTPVSVLLRWRAPSCGAVQACCSRPPTCCCSTSPPTTWTPNRFCGSKSSCTSYPGAVIAVTHDRYFLDNVAEWICEVDRGQLYPYKGNYSTYLETKAKRMEIQGSQGRQARQAPQERARMGARHHRRLVRPRTRPVLSATTRWSTRPRNSKKLDFSEIQIPAGPAPGLHRARGRAHCTRPSATACSSTT